MKWNRSHSELIKNGLAVFAVLLISATGIKLISDSSAATGATLSLSSQSTSLTPNGTLAVTIKEDSGTDPINSVQASMNYDASQLQFVSLSEGTAFTTIAANSTATPGVIRVGRATQGTPVTGANNIVTVNFKVLAASGNVGLSFDKNYSFVVRSTDSADVLTATTPANYAVAGAVTASASMSLSPATGSATNGSTVNVTVRENSGSTAVNSVQAAVGYDSTQLQYTGISEGGTFTNIAATDSGTAGRVRVARSVQAGANGVSGDNSVVTLSFKVLSTSGTSTLSIDKAQSFVVSSVDNKDILSTVAGNSFTITGGTQTGAASTLSLSPETGSYAVGSTIAVQVKAVSTDRLTTVQSTLNYPADKLQYVSTTDGSVFTTVQRTKTDVSGIVDIIRSIPGGNAGVTGTNPVVTVNFKVLATGTAAVTYGTTSALFDDSGSGTNILNRTNSKTASYTLTSGTVTPPTPPPASGSGTLSLTPATSSLTNGSTVAVTVKANSSTAKLTTVEAGISYPSDKLQFTSVSETGPFTTVQRTKTDVAGTLDIIRSIPGGNAGVTGTNPVVTVNFKVIGSSGNAALAYTTLAGLYDDSGSGISVLDKASSATASYTIGGAPTCSASPSMPGVPTRTASSYTTTSFNWAASTAASNCTIAGYHVYRNGAAIGDVTTGNTFTDSGLTSGTSYSYTVKAFDTAGHESSSSAAANITSKTDDMAPTTPVSFTAAAANSASVALTWAGSTDFPNPGGVGVQGYKIYRNNGSAALYTVTTGLGFTDSNVVPNTTYSYTVTAYDKLGNESAPSNIVSAKTPAAPVTCTGSPSTPAGLTAGASTLSGTSLSWSASAAATGCQFGGYRVFRNANLVGTVTTTNFTDSGLTAGTSYNYTVQAFDTSGHSSSLSTALTIASLRDTTSPIGPGAVTAIAPSAGQVTISWTQATDNVAVTGYTIYRGTTKLTTTSASTRSYSDTTVSANTSYTYTVSASDASGNEGVKVQASPSPIKTPAASDTTAPTTPSGLKIISVATTGVIIGWNASADATGVAGYHLYSNGSYVGDSSGTSYTAKNLRPNQQYTYMVKAFDAAGNTSGASADLIVKLNALPGRLVADLNGDDKVDSLDLSIIVSHWKEQKVPYESGDIDGDGFVDVFDLSTLLTHYGEKK